MVVVGGGGVPKLPSLLSLTGLLWSGNSFNDDVNVSPSRIILHARAILIHGVYLIYTLNTKNFTNFSFCNKSYATGHRQCWVIVYIFHIEYSHRCQLYQESEL
jgi:hypothetical protein